MDTNSKIVKVIETRFEDVIRYHTFEGILIGEIKGGERQPRKEEYPKERKLNSGIVRSKTPQQMRKIKDREAESLKDPKSRLKHLREDVL